MEPNKFGLTDEEMARLRDEIFSHDDIVPAIQEHVEVIEDERFFPPVISTPAQDEQQRQAFEEFRHETLEDE